MDTSRYKLSILTAQNASLESVAEQVAKILPDSTWVADTADILLLTLSDWNKSTFIVEIKFVRLVSIVSFSCPRQLQSEKEMFLTGDWLINPTLLQRGIRHFDSSSFTSFSLETFTLINKT